MKRLMQSKTRTLTLQIPVQLTLTPYTASKIPAHSSTIYNDYRPINVHDYIRHQYQSSVVRIHSRRCYEYSQSQFKVQL